MKNTIFHAKFDDIYPLKTFFNPLNTCKIKLNKKKQKICFLLPQWETTIIGEEIALKLNVFTNIGFYSLKL